jgi:hypothetical protein
MNLGSQEYLVGASPEMFVRVEEVENSDLGRRALRVETCPISGTVARGADALEDAKNIQAILSNEKEVRGGGKGRTMDKSGHDKIFVRHLIPQLTQNKTPSYRNLSSPCART